MLVTASVDAIQLRKRLAIETDMTIQGQVVWTGSHLRRPLMGDSLGKWDTWKCRVRLMSQA